MTDAFASESNAPRGLAPEPAQPGEDVTGTLAELERKLRELEQELTSIGRRRESAAAAPVAPMAAAASSGRLVDEAIEPVPAEPTPPRASDAQLASLAELRRFRDRLERAGRELATEYDALLGRVASSLTGSPAPAPTAAGSLATTQDMAAETAAAPTAPAPAAAPPVASPPAPPVGSPPAPSAAPAPEASRENALFEGRVELGVGPFYDIASLGSFERRLASLPGVSEATVRRFEASHAVVDVRLASPTALVHELRRVLDSDFGVREIASGRILLTFDDA